MKEIRREEEIEREKETRKRHVNAKPGSLMKVKYVLVNGMTP